MNSFKVFSLMLLIFIACGAVSAQNQDITVGDIVLPPTKWGDITLPIELTNNSEYLKFVTVEIEIDSKGSTISSKRSYKSHDFLLPEERKTINAMMNIPPNFGTINLFIKMYDVVDTLDVILPHQKFFEQPFFLKPGIPEKIYDYLNDVMTFPPLVNESRDFDNEFLRVIFIMLNEGKAVDEIASIAEVEPMLVNSLLQPMVQKGYVAFNDGSYKLNFPVITVPEAEESRVLALKVADYLAENIAKDMPLYFKTRDSLVQAGVIATDSNDFINGGTVTYHLYPVISALLLWQKLGHSFITREAPLIIFDNTDLCKAHIPYYMYIVQGGAVFNGSHLFSFNLSQQNYQFQFGDSIPALICPDYMFDRKQLRWATSQLYDSKENPEIFTIDTAAVLPVVEPLAAKHYAYLRDVYAQLFKIADKYGHYKLSFGHRYWFWNLVATRTMERLVNKKVVARTGNGQFRMDGQRN